MQKILRVQIGAKHFFHTFSLYIKRFYQDFLDSINNSGKYLCVSSINNEGAATLPTIVLNLLIFQYIPKIS